MHACNYQSYSGLTIVKKKKKKKIKVFALVVR